VRSTPKNTIATRELFYSLDGESERRCLTVCITAPAPLVSGSVPFEFDEGAASCSIIFDGFPEQEIVVHGMDTMQALTFAVNIDPYLRGFSRKHKCSFFFVTGDPYFDD
jgi:hypothetical protein